MSIIPLHLFTTHAFHTEFGQNLFDILGGNGETQAHAGKRQLSDFLESAFGCHVFSATLPCRPPFSIRAIFAKKWWVHVNIPVWASLSKLEGDKVDAILQTVHLGTHLLNSVRMFRILNGINECVYIYI